MKRRVVVTGGGMLTALGRTWEEASEKLKQCKNLIQYMSNWECYTKMNTRLACPYTQPLPKFPRKKVRGMGRVALLSLIATDDALKMAGFVSQDGTVSQEIQNGLFGIAYGSCMGSMESLKDLVSMIETHDTS